MSFYRNQLEEWIRNLSIEANTVIDVGGGDKPMTKRELRKWQVSNYAIFDHDNEFSPNITGDINEPLTHARAVDDLGYKALTERADVVLCFEVAEYVWNPVQFHQNLYELLKPNGVLYISYPTWYPLHNPPEIDYLRYTKHGIEKLLSMTGFVMEEITPRKATAGLEALSSFYSLEGMHPLRHEPAVFDIGYMVKAREGSHNERPATV